MEKYKYFAELDITPVGEWIVKRHNRFVLDLIHRWCKQRPLSIFEIGPGHGWFAIACRDQGYAYYAIEQNEAMAERLRGQGFQVNVGSVPPFPEGEETDIIVMQHVLEHMHNAEEALALIYECRRRLKPDGILVVCCPDITIMKEEFYDCDYTHAFPTSERRLRQMFHDAGLTIVEAGVRNFLFGSKWLLRVQAFFTRLAYSSGALLIFGNKAYVAKTTLYGFCYIVGRVHAE